MMRVLVMAESTLLADAIASSLAQDVNLRILRLTQQDPGRISDATDEEGSTLIIIEEIKSNHRIITTSDLFPDYGCFRIITASSHTHHLYHSYEMPISRMPQPTHRAKGLNRELLK